LKRLITIQSFGTNKGAHTYTAQYPKDAFYDTLLFGSVTVKADAATQASE
jgi:hypothetical protein